MQVPCLDHSCYMIHTTLAILNKRRVVKYDDSPPRTAHSPRAYRPNTTDAWLTRFENLCASLTVSMKFKVSVAPLSVRSWRDSRHYIDFQNNETWRSYRGDIGVIAGGIAVFNESHIAAICGRRRQMKICIFGGQYALIGPKTYYEAWLIQALLKLQILTMDRPAILRTSGRMGVPELLWGKTPAQGAEILSAPGFAIKDPSINAIRQTILNAWKRDRALTPGDSKQHRFGMVDELWHEMGPFAGHEESEVDNWRGLRTICAGEGEANAAPITLARTTAVARMAMGSTLVGGCSVWANFDLLFRHGD